MNQDKIVFLGDSITANFKLLDNYHQIINLGIGGDKTTEILSRIKDVYPYKPHKLFLLIGINDFLVNKKVWEYPSEINIIKNIETIIKQLIDNLPNTFIYSLSILPIGINQFIKNSLLLSYNEEINLLNEDIKKISHQYDVTYININEYFKNSSGLLNDIYSLDGIHLTEEGYNLFIKLIKKYI